MTTIDPTKISTGRYRLARAPFIVAAVQALMDLDGLRAGEAAALDVAKERDEARALAEGLTRGQDDLRRQLAAMEAERDRADALSLRLAEETATLRNLHHGALAGLEEMTGRRDLAVQDRNEARERMKKAEAEAAVAGEALRIAEVERDRLQLENGRLREVCEDMQVQAGALMILVDEAAAALSAVRWASARTRSTGRTCTPDAKMDFRTEDW